MFWNKGRVEADLQKIREANLPYEKEKAEESASQLQKARALAGRIGVKDVVAMIIAIFSLVLPYVIVFICVIGLALGLFVWWIQ